MSRAELRQAIIDWLDDHYHFGDAEDLIVDDDASFLDSGVLDSLGFVQLILFLEDSLAIRIDRKLVQRENFDGMNRILLHVFQYVRQEAG